MAIKFIKRVKKTNRLGLMVLLLVFLCTLTSCVTVSSKTSNGYGPVSVFHYFNNNIAQLDSINIKFSRNNIPITSRGRCTAFCVDTAGFYLTCAHCVSDQSTLLPFSVLSIRHFFNKGANSTDREVKVVSIDSEHDIALVKVNGKPLTDTLPISFDFSETYNIGDKVCYFGCPYPIKEQGDIVFRRGIISGYSFSRASRGENLIRYFLIDGNIDTGLSGSPVILAKTNKVIGIIAARPTNNISSVGYVLPIQHAYPMLKKYIDLSK